MCLRGKCQRDDSAEITSCFQARPKGSDISRVRCACASAQVQQSFLQPSNAVVVAHVASQTTCVRIFGWDLLTTRFQLVFTLTTQSRAKHTFTKAHVPSFLEGTLHRYTVPGHVEGLVSFPMSSKCFLKAAIAKEQEESCEAYCTHDAIHHSASRRKPYL